MTMCNKNCACDRCKMTKGLVRDSIVIGAAADQIRKMYEMDLLLDGDMTGFIQMCANVVAAYTITKPEDAEGQDKEEPGAESNNEEEPAPEGK